MVGYYHLQLGRILQNAPRPQITNKTTSSYLLLKRTALRKAVGQRVPSDRRSSSATRQGPPAYGARPNFHKQSPSTMPVTNRVALPSAEYLKAQPPSWETLQTGLSIFALFVIVRYCVQQIYSWLRPTERHNPVPSADNLNLHQHPYQYLYQPYHPSHHWPMDEKSSQESNFGVINSSNNNDNSNNNYNQHLGFGDERADSRWRPASDSLPRQFISRLPPAPPLTPPELSNAVFTLEERPHDQDSFIHQPNPDYMSSTATSFEAEYSDSSSIPRRRSYTRTLSIGTNMSRQAQQQQQQSSEGDNSEHNHQTFSPSSSTSYTSAGRLLSNSSGQGPDEDVTGEVQRNVDIQGEIISVLDREGAGWTRHTRVYGGGACLACAASGGGGFYGATVTPEEMR